MTDWTVHRFGDNNEYAIRLKPNNEYVVDFQICVDREYSGNDLALEMEIEGHIKWDGCMNWQTDPKCMYHFCSDGDVDMLAMLLKKVWELAKPIFGDKCDY